jgi:hypothetical protein
MCGIFGWNLKAGAVGDAARLVLARSLGSMNDSRGGDGWGCWTPDMKRPLKGLGNFRGSGAADRMAESLRAIGHTRKACSGSVVAHNSHPFRKASTLDRTRVVVGCHNGMVFNHADMAADLGIDRYEVDSEILIQMISDKRRLELADGVVQGYGVLCWTVEGYDGINLCQMRHGQLSVAGLGTAEAPIGVVWSSDRVHLETALKVAGLAEVAFPYGLVEGEVVRAKEGCLYTSNMRINLGGRRVSRNDAEATGMLWRDAE